MTGSILTMDTEPRPEDVSTAGSSGTNDPEELAGELLPDDHDPWNVGTEDDGTEAVNDEPSA
jgi:hypothetical protein